MCVLCVYIASQWEKFEHLSILVVSHRINICMLTTQTVQKTCWPKLIKINPYFSLSYLSGYRIFLLIKVYVGKHNNDQLLHMRVIKGISLSKMNLL